MFFLTFRGGLSSLSTFYPGETNCLEHLFSAKSLNEIDTEGLLADALQLWEAFPVDFCTAADKFTCSPRTRQIIRTKDDFPCSLHVLRFWLSVNYECPRFGAIGCPAGRENVFEPPTTTHSCSEPHFRLSLASSQVHVSTDIVAEM